MATKKTTNTTATETAVTETKVTETVKAEPAKKTPAKKAPAKKAPKKVAPKKPAAVVAAINENKEVKVEAPVVTTPVETKVNFFVEFGGVQVSVDEVVENVKATLGKNAKEIAVYLKPEESKAYFVADGETMAMDVYFC